MKRINIKYGLECNLLQLTQEELKQLEPFLLALGVRCRISQDNFNGECVIQAENVYKTRADLLTTTRAESLLTEDNIKSYKSF